MIKVLIVDDEKKICQLICNLVDYKSLEMEVIGFAHHGFDALEKIKSHTPDIVITDIRMPGMDGLDLIKNSQNLSKIPEFIIISGYKNFEYAQNAMKYGVNDYILKPIEAFELSKTLQRIKEKININSIKINDEKKFKEQNKQFIEQKRISFFKEKLLKNEIENLEIEKINDLYSYSFESEVFQTAILKIDFLNEKKIDLNNFYIIQEKVVQVFKNVFDSFAIEIEFFSEESIIYIIFNFKKDRENLFSKEINNAFEALLIHKTIINNIIFTLCLDDFSRNLNEVKNSFKRCKIAMYNRILDGYGKINYFVPNENDEEVINKIFRNFNKNIKSSLEIFDIEKIKSTIDDFQNSILNSKKISGKKIYYLILDSFKYFITQLKYLNFKINDLDNIVISFEENAILYGRLENLLNYFKKNIIELSEELIVSKKLETKKPIRIAKQYILENYMNPITLETISEIINFNATYFSSLFKKETGENFSEFLFQVRMNKAKEFLRDTNFTIATICELTGYQDTKHFTQGFKKYTGIKPTEFRKLYS